MFIDADIQWVRRPAMFCRIYSILKFFFFFFYSVHFIPNTIIKCMPQGKLSNDSNMEMAFKE